MPLVARVALDLKIFDYAVPEHLQNALLIGHCVEVPLKNSLKKGIVLDLTEKHSPYPLRPIQNLLSHLIPKELLQVAHWMADYYCTPLPLILPSLLPAAVKQAQEKNQYWVMRNETREMLRKQLPLKSFQQNEILNYMLQVEGKALLTEVLENTNTSRSSVDALVKRGFLKIEKAKVDRSPLVGEEYFRTQAKSLTEEQNRALNQIETSLVSHTYKTHLLHGVTGSGKTEIYLQAIAKALELKLGVIMLVPEIALTSQTIEHFKSRFDGHIAILHYRLSAGEKHDEWKRMQKGEAKIAIGARSAVFSPIQNLGLILVDEEHENSYKQSDLMPSYHAREVAIMRGFFSNATVVLGSATPSLESYQNAKSGKYTLSTLKERPRGAPLAKVTLIDMKNEQEKGSKIFSEALLSGIEKRLEKGEQTLLFLNRRGYHSSLLCSSCGNALKCAQCDLSLTYHKSVNSLTCHLCHETLSPPPLKCPHCQAEGLLKFRGIGTEQVEAALYAIFPNIRILRLDADTTKHKGSHQKLYRAFRTGKADLLIGTQMIAKGLHFPEVTLVGILNSDQSLNIPDFRSGETTFQLLTQVAGRAGRGVIEGEVLIQTFIPENSTICHASKQDFLGFFEEEIQIRKAFDYPPFSHFAKIRFTGKDLEKTKNLANHFREAIIALLPQGFTISAVDSAGHAKIKEQHRLQFLIKGPTMPPIRKAIQQTQSKFPSTSSLRIHVDINPVSLFY